MNLQVCYNNDYIDSKLIENLQNNRMFTYSDGLFETLILKENKIKYWSYHLQRIEKAFKVLQLQKINIEQIEKNILELSKINNLNNARLNIYFWRESSGYYTPLNNTYSYLIKFKPYVNSNSTIKNVGICNSIQNHYSSYSFFKTNSLKYVLAGLEKKENNWDDIIILDQNQNISECLSSNIFWIKNGIYHTPSIETGCIEGVYRNYLLNQLKDKQIPFKIGKWKAEELLNADEVFTTNVNGIRKIKRVLHY